MTTARQRSRIRTIAPTKHDNFANELWFVEVVVLVVLRALQGRLECKTLLGNLVYPHARLYHDRSRVRSARVAGLGRGVCLPRTRPTGIEKPCQGWFIF